MDTERLASMIYKLATVGQQPESSWVDMFLAASQANMAFFSAGQLCRTIWGLATLQQRPPDDWLEAFLSTSQGQMSAFSASELSQLVWSLGTLKVKPNKTWVSQYLQAAGSKLHQMSRTELADVPWAIASMGYRPADAWLTKVADSSLHHQLPMLGPEHLAKLCWALATFAWMPPAEWLSSFALEAVYQPSMSVQGYAAVLWSIACFQVLPEPLFMALFYTATGGALQELPADGLVNVLWAIAAVENARLANKERREQEQQQQQMKSQMILPEQASSSTSDAGADTAAVRKLITEMVKERAAGTGSTTAMIERSSRASAGDAVDAAQQDEEMRRLELQLRDAEAQYTGTFRPVPVWQEDLLSELQGQMLSCPEEFDKVAVVKLLWALAQLQVTPENRWMRQLLEIAEGHLKQDAFEPLELVYVVRSCSLLLDCQGGNSGLPDEFGLFMSGCVEALGRVKRLPPEWKKINVQYAPYAVPRNSDGAVGFDSRHYS